MAEKLKSGLLLDEDEKLVMELEAELWATSGNLFARIWATIRKFLALLFGTKISGYIVLTDKRIVEVTTHKMCWVFNAGKAVKYVLPSSVKEVGYTEAGTFCGCFCKSYHLYYESFTQTREVLLTGLDEAGTQKIVAAFYNTIKKVQ